MHCFAEKSKAGRPATPIRHTIERRTVQRFVAPGSGSGGHDFSRIPVHDKNSTLREKSVDGVSDNRVGLVEDKDPDGGPGKVDAGPPVKKTAGVDSFEVKWTKNPVTSPTVAKLLLNYVIKFKKDATHDPAVAEFRQNAFHKIEITAGSDKGFKNDNSPLHDDNYSRADDTGGNAIGDVNFVSNDNPGASPLDKDDVIDYSFTAEQMVIDTSDGNKVVAKRGPHTATIKGKDPRAFDGVPATL